MAWDPSEDEPFRQNAALLQKHVGSTWLVFWGTGSRQYWAFRRGGSSLILSHPDPQQLYANIQRHAPHRPAR
jgi:hypothetical protein